MRAWRDFGTPPPKAYYTRLTHEHARHHERFVRHVEAHGLMCQECGGSGQVVDDVVDFGDASVGSIPFEITGECFWCEGTGKITRRTRGLWLRCKQEDARKDAIESGNVSLWAWRDEALRAALAAEKGET